MQYFVCIDDTDMPGTKGTGWLAQELGEQITQNGQGTLSAITRHQLFVHEDVPYTSHNSSMCFELSLSGGSIEPVIAFMADFYCGDPRKDRIQACVWFQKTRKEITAL